jgi:proteasome lid subunit RPN8/RPN11
MPEERARGTMESMTRIVVDREDLAVLEAHLIRAYPREGCGVLVGRDGETGRTVEAVVGVENVRAEESGRYEIHPERFLEIEKRARDAGASVVGFFHSHPDRPAEPSRFDRAHAWAYYSYVIASVVEGRLEEVRSFRLSDGNGDFEAEEMVIAEPRLEPGAPA